jgi:hypothetical protein
LSDSPSGAPKACFGKAPLRSFALATLDRPRYSGVLQLIGPRRISPKAALA